MRAPQIGFPQLVQDFFLQRLITQPGASARTVESYRDAFELLFGYIEKHTGTSPSALQMADLDAPLVLDFLDHLENERHNSARTRNARLAAIHSFMRYAAVRDPVSLPVTSRVLAIPAKRFDRPVLGYLTRGQIAAILTAPARAGLHAPGVTVARYLWCRRRASMRCHYPRGGLGRHRAGLRLRQWCPGW